MHNCWVFVVLSLAFVFVCILTVKLTCLSSTNINNQTMSKSVAGSSETIKTEKLTASAPLVSEVDRDLGYVTEKVSALGVAVSVEDVYLSFQDAFADFKERYPSCGGGALLRAENGAWFFSFTLETSIFGSKTRDEVRRTIQAISLRRSRFSRLEDMRGMIFGGENKFVEVSRYQCKFEYVPIKTV